MSDIKCPYCGTDQDINHADGCGYEEDERHVQDCIDCGKEFEFTTHTSYHYDVYCREESDHKMKPFGDKFPGMYGCENCDFYELRKEES